MRSSGHSPPSKGLSQKLIDQFRVPYRVVGPHTSRAGALAPNVLDLILGGVPWNGEFYGQHQKGSMVMRKGQIFRNQGTEGTVKPHPDMLDRAGAVVKRLEGAIDPAEWGVRCTALNTLARLPPATLSAHAATIAARLEDPTWSVRRAALGALDRLDSVDLSERAVAIVKRLQDSEAMNRRAALGVLARLESPSLSAHACAVAARLEDACDGVRCAALLALSKLDSAELSGAYACAIAARLEDEADDVRGAALRALGELTKVELSAHAGAVAALLADSDSSRRTLALGLLGRLDRVALCEAGAVVTTLADSDLEVREKALAILAKLDPAMIIDLIVPMQASEHVEVRQWALDLVAELYAPGGVGARAAKDDFEYVCSRQRRRSSI